MPFKTRQKKEAAASRRYSYIEAASSLSYNSAKTVASAKEKVVDDKKSKTLTRGEDFFFVSRDLVKIVILSASIIVLQAILKFVQGRGIFHF